MEFLTTLLSESVYFDQLTYASGWLGWVVLLLLVLGLNWYGRGFHVPWTRRQVITLVVLLLLVPIATIFIGVRLPVGDASTIPGRPIEPRGPAMMLLAAIPMMLAAGLLGPASAAGLGALTGALIGLLDTHSPFTPLEYALAATLLSLMLRQPFRTISYRLLRHPLVAALMTAVIYPFIYVFGNLFFVGDTLADRVEYGLSRVGWVSAAFLGQILLASLIAIGVSLLFSDAWGPKETKQPAPAQTSLQTRFIYNTAPLITFLFADAHYRRLDGGAEGQPELFWENAFRPRRNFLRKPCPLCWRRARTLLPNLQMMRAFTAWLKNDIIPILEEDIRSVPFFLQLFVLDEFGQPVAGFPVRDFSSILPNG